MMGAKRGEHGFYQVWPGNKKGHTLVRRSLLCSALSNQTKTLDPGLRRDDGSWCGDLKTSIVIPAKAGIQRL
jgi:hypothetical protein